MVTLFTNAPPAYDYPTTVSAGTIVGCRVLDCPDNVAATYQIHRNESGLFWATSDIEVAAEMRSRFPYTEEVTK